MTLKLLFSFLLILPLTVFSQTENFWTKKNDFGGLKRERAVAFSIGDYGYIGTGVDTAEVVLKDLWQYDAVNDLWVQKADMPGSVRRDAISFTIGNKGYVGTGLDNDESFAGNKLKDFWEYDPATNNWTQKADFPGSGGLGIYFSTGFSIDSKGYICGGKVGPNTYSNQLWEYKPTINQWTQRANFPGGVRYQLASFTIGYNAYVGLGANQDIFKKDFWKYNPGTNQWSPIADLPASERGGACTFTIGNRGYVCTGSDGGLLEDLWAYNPSTDQWSIRAPYGASERKNAVAFVVNNKAYLGTGKGFSGKKQNIEEYTPYDLLGIEEMSTNSFSVYPNPAHQSFTIESENILVNRFQIYSSDGRLIKEIEYNQAKKKVIQCEDLNAGVYILVAFDASQTVLKTEQIILF